MLKLLGLVGLACCTISGVLIIATPRMANYLDGAAWIVLGLYTGASFFLTALTKQQSAASHADNKEGK